MGLTQLNGEAWPYLVHLVRRKEWNYLARDFGGYFWRHGRIPPLRGGFRVKLSRLMKREDAFREYPECLNENFESRLNLRERWVELEKEKRAHEHPIHPSAYEALHSGYWAAVLETEDAGWTHVSLEARAPLLDLRLRRFLLRLPPVPWCADKELCRRAMKEMLPGVVVERPKTPLPKVKPSIVLRVL